MQALRLYEEHLQRATQERSLYRTVGKEATDLYKSHIESPAFIAATAAEDTPLIDFTHYSFDFAQQVHLPSDPLQPGPIYFLTPRKCVLFGVCCEAIPLQVRYRTVKEHVKVFLVCFRSTTSLTRVWLLGRGPTQSSVCSTTVSNIIASENRKSIYTQTTALGKIKIML